VPGHRFSHVKGLSLATRQNSTIIDLNTLDLNHVVADQEQIRKYNPQRFEMEQINAVLLEDTERAICVGYKDVRYDEFWVAGHMPDMPLMPGVLICEAAAQLASYFTLKYDLLGAQVVGLGGIEDVRIRGRVVPGDRLVLALQQIKLRRGALIVCRFEGFVDYNLVAEGKIMGARLQ
jgi:3-hydroxyacyl-[acyl-carrier-protein] dehydratase